ncbi:MAG: hypothetical protein RIQ93_2228 [Verrucomicrobiota bacterium]|jgi:sugar phosphate isomerase/epimerase
MQNKAGGEELDRRGFFKTVGGGVTAAALMLTPQEQAKAQAMDEKSKLNRIASCSWPIRFIFKSLASRIRRGPPANAAGDAPPAGRGGQGPGSAGLTSEELKKLYGELTMMDFPQFTKDTFPGVTQMDIRSSLFGDVSDESMFTQGIFDPSTASGKKWLDKFAAKTVETGTKVRHISNNAPTNLASSDTALRKAGVEVGKKWLDGAKLIGARTVRMNSPQALGPSLRPPASLRPGDQYPKNDDILPLLAAAIESYKEMADYGGNLGIKVTIENHWGLAADPMNVRAILDEVNHPYCEASPDFGNWEHEYHLFNGLKALAPYAHTHVHAKYWDRWGNKNDVQRSTRIMLAAGFKGTFALEYEAGPLNGIEGAKYLFKEVMAALSSPVPVV